MTITDFIFIFIAANIVLLVFYYFVFIPFFDPNTKRSRQQELELAQSLRAVLEDPSIPDDAKQTAQDGYDIVTKKP